jgi:hypothetical protein
MLIRVAQVIILMGYMMHDIICVCATCANQELHNTHKLILDLSKYSDNY